MSWVISFVLLVGLGEIFLRWHYFGLPHDIAHLPHPYLQNTLNPSFTLWSNENLRKIGKFGIRNTGPYNRSDETYNIITIGDSCTFSVTSASELTSYPAVLEQALSGNVEVYNAGVPGYNTMQMFLYLHLLFKDIDPDEVIIYGGWNDVNITRHDRGALYIENNTGGIPKVYRHRMYWELHDKIKGRAEKFLAKSYLYNHVKFKIEAHYVKKDIVSFWQSNGLESMPDPPLLIPEVFDNFRNNMESIIALAKGKGAKVAVITLATPLQKTYSKEYEKIFMDKFGNDISNFLRLTPAELYYYIEHFNAIIRELADVYNIQLYDWERWYREVNDVSMFADVIHPTDKGYAYMINKIVTERRGSLEYQGKR